MSGLERFLDRDGRLRVMPRKAADRRAALEWLAERFERGRDYAEREVNEVLRDAHAFGDPALLRRDLFEAGLLARERDGRRYWRPRGPTIRDETDADRAAVLALVSAAFAGKPYASGTEAEVHAALHRHGAASVALVAEEGGRIVGQVDFSPVTIGGRPSRWHALGPLAVAPDRQRQGVGTSLVTEGLARLKALGSGGCVVEGDGAYYRRFGFRAPVALTAPGLPAEFVFVLPFGPEPTGDLAFHPAFGT